MANSRDEEIFRAVQQERLARIEAGKQYESKTSVAKMVEPDGRIQGPELKPAFEHAATKQNTPSPHEKIAGRIPDGSKMIKEDGNRHNMHPPSRIRSGPDMQAARGKIQNEHQQKMQQMEQEIAAAKARQESRNNDRIKDGRERDD